MKKMIKQHGEGGCNWWQDVTIVANLLVLNMKGVQNEGITDLQYR